MLDQSAKRLLVAEPVIRGGQFLPGRLERKRASSRVPIASAAVLGKGPAIQYRSGSQTHLRGLDLQANPFAGLGQRTHRKVIFLATCTKKYHVLAPERAMLPVRAVVELQHDGFEIGR